MSDCHRFRVILTDTTANKLHSESVDDDAGLRKALHELKDELRTDSHAHAGGSSGTGSHAHTSGSFGTDVLLVEKEQYVRKSYITPCHCFNIHLRP